jgi:hypothetical protein
MKKLIKRQSSTAGCGAIDRAVKNYATFVEVFVCLLNLFLFSTVLRERWFQVRDNPFSFDGTHLSPMHFSFKKVSSI